MTWYRDRPRYWEECSETSPNICSVTWKIKSHSKITRKNLPERSSTWTLLDHQTHPLNMKAARRQPSWECVIYVSIYTYNYVRTYIHTNLYLYLYFIFIYNIYIYIILINSYIKKWMVKAALDAGALEGPGRDARRQSQLSTANSGVRGVEGDTDDAHWTVTWMVVNAGRNYLGYPQCIHNVPGLVNIQKTIEHGHRNSWFSQLENCDFP